MACKNAWFSSLILTGVVASCTSVVAGPVPAQKDPATPKGVVVESVTTTEAAKPSSPAKHNLGVAEPTVKFSIKLFSPDGESTLVPVTHAFHESDRFQLQFELTRESYIYILNRTILGDLESGAKGIGIASSKVTPLKLLFPTQKAGTKNKLEANVIRTVPRSNDPPFVMDSVSGVEQVFLLVSAKPVAIDKYFDLRDGTLLPAFRDSDEELIERLKSMESNGEVSLPKGIGVDSVGTSRVQSKPILVPVNLKHYSKSDQ